MILIHVSRLFPILALIVFGCQCEESPGDTVAPPNENTDLAPIDWTATSDSGVRPVAQDSRDAGEQNTVEEVSDADGGINVVADAGVAEEEPEGPGR